MPSDLQQVVDRVVQEKLGHEQLRPGQDEAIAAVLADHDTLVVMPTGSGKSAIFQIVGALIPGVTVVVSPLIALQQDQVEAITEIDAGGAALLNSASTMLTASVRGVTTSARSIFASAPSSRRWHILVSWRAPRPHRLQCD